MKQKNPKKNPNKINPNNNKKQKNKQNPQNLKQIETTQRFFIFLCTSSFTPEGSFTPLLCCSLTAKQFAEFQFIFIITHCSCYVLLGFLFLLIIGRWLSSIRS